MKNLIKLLVIVAIVAAIGFSVVGCGGDDDNGGGDELGLYISDIHTGGNIYMVKFGNSSNFSVGDYVDFELTIDGNSVTITNDSSGTLNGTTTYSLYFEMDSALTVGTKYAVVVKYTGSKVASFTREGTVPLESSK